MPSRKRSTVSIGAAYGAAVGLDLSACLSLIEYSSLRSQYYSWLSHGFGPLSNAAAAYGLALYGLAGAIVGAAVGAVLFWVMSLRGRLFALRWGWLLVSLAAFAVLLVFGGRSLNYRIFPPQTSFSFYVFNGLYAVAALALSVATGALARRLLGLSKPRPKPAVGRLLRWAAAAAVALGLYFALSLALLAWLGPRKAPAGAQRAASGARPNVLLVVIETTRADHLSCYGYERKTTPSIDSWIAEQGVLFESASVTAPFTGPSKASILTGRYPHSHGVRDHPQLLDYGEITLAEVFGAHGYATASIGAGEWEDPRYGYHQGYDLYNSLTAAYQRGSFWPFATTFRLRLNVLAPWYTDDVERLGQLRAERAVETARHWMESRVAEGRPFMLTLELNEPHCAYEPPPPFDTAFGPTEKGKALMREMLSNNRGKGLYRYDYDSLGYGPEVLEQAIALYDGEIAYVDDALGKLFEAMSAAGYLESTVVVVTADHGENFGEHGSYFCHGYLYQTSLHVPLLIRYLPEIPPGMRVAAPVETIDIFPTLLELADIPSQGLPVEGQSLLRTMRTGRGKSYCFAESRYSTPSFARYKNFRIRVPGLEGKWRAVRYGNWKLIRIPTPAGIEWELYNLAEDPGETVNIAGQYAVQDTLRAVLERWMQGGAAGVEPERITDQETLERLRSLGYVD